MDRDVREQFGVALGRLGMDRHHLRSTDGSGESLQVGDGRVSRGMDSCEQNPVLCEPLAEAPP